MIATVELIKIFDILACSGTIIFSCILAGWLCYCIHSIARAADALERIANALAKKNGDVK